MRKLLHPPETEGRILIDIRGVAYLSSLSVTTIQTLIAEKRFPPGIKCGCSRNASRRWVKSELVAFLERGLDMARTAEVPRGS